MKLREMKRFPRKIGCLVKLIFDKDMFHRPFLEMNDIHIPLRPSVEFFWLHGRTQFLLYIPRSALGRQSHQESGVWFGGIDENVFLTKMDSRILRIFRKGGVEAFYKALEPEIIKKLKSLFVVQSKRQGDIHAASVRVTWNQLSFHRNLGQPPLPNPIRTNRMPIFRTSHKLTGSYWERLCDSNSRPVPYLPIIFASGTVESPDHRPMKLGKTVHVLARTQYLERLTRDD
jgi:hypothetical protein